MGFFSNFFKSKPSRDEFVDLTNTLSHAMDGALELFYWSCLEELKKQGLNIKNEEVGGEADTAIRAYQLQEAMQYIGINQYVEPSEGAFFADLLYVDYCGNKIAEVGKVGERYYNAEQNDRGKSLQLFSLDIAKYICSEEALSVIPASISISKCTLPLVVGQKVFISAAFGDSISMRSQSRKLDEINAKYK